MNHKKDYNTTLWWSWDDKYEEGFNLGYSIGFNIG
jgi:hypothetical protein